MRTHTLLLIQLASGIVAGGLLVFATGQSSPATMALAGLGGALIAVAGFMFSWMKIKRSQQILMQIELAGAATMTGLPEMDAIGQAFAQQVQKLDRSNTSEAEELRDIHELLDKLDRRKNGHQRDETPQSCATRLSYILKGIGNNLDSNLRQTLSSSRELRRAVDELVSGSEVQSDLMSTATNFVEELTARIMAVCDNTEQALESTAGVRSQAEQGVTQFQEVAQDVKKIRNQASARERKFQTLNQHTKEIESIVETIGTLSSRTDLLALNASIESVRAGEHGRGFAIVAEEVRALAEQSAQAVLDISRHLELIQLETQQSQAGASGELDQLQRVNERVTSTLEGLEQICQTANHSIAELNDISADSNRQLQLTQQIVATIEQGTDHCQKNRSRAEGANWTAKTLIEVTGQLNESVESLEMSIGIKSNRDDRYSADDSYGSADAAMASASR